MGKVKQLLVVLLGAIAVCLITGCESDGIDPEYVAKLEEKLEEYETWYEYAHDEIYASLDNIAYSVGDLVQASYFEYHWYDGDIDYYVEVTEDLYDYADAIYDEVLSDLDAISRAVSIAPWF